MRIKITQAHLDKHRTYWFACVNWFTRFSSGSNDPIVLAVTEQVGRGAKVEYWPRLQVGVMTKCRGGYYMFDLPDEVVKAGSMVNGCFVMERPVEFDLPIEPFLQSEEEYEARLEQQQFAYSI